MSGLAETFSTIDSYKRRLADALRNPGLSMQKMLGDANDRSRGFNQRNEEAARGALGNPKQMALAMELADAYNPTGMIKMSHGSPHLFDKFDSSKINTGQGAQSYGYGHYAGEGFNSPVAKSYQKELSTSVSVDGKPVLVGGRKVGTTGNNTIDDLLIMHSGDLKAATKDQLSQIRGLRERFSNQPKMTAPAMVGVENKIIKEAQQELAQLRGLRGRSSTETGGHLYNIEAKWPDALREAKDPLGKQHFLDWDAPLSKQPKAVQEALQDLSGKDALGRPLEKAQPLDMNKTGQWAYMDIQNGRNQRLASEALQKRGIPGVRYLDGNSRGAGQGTSNYVTFPGNENMLNIIERNGQPVEVLIEALRKKGN